jgi:hypothetical protein
MQDGCTVYMDSYMASNGSCFMVTWIIFNNRLLARVGHSDMYLITHLRRKGIYHGAIYLKKLELFTPYQYI